MQQHLHTVATELRCNSTYTKNDGLAGPSQCCWRRTAFCSLMLESVMEPRGQGWLFHLALLPDGRPLLAALVHSCCVLSVAGQLGRHTFGCL